MYRWQDDLLLTQAVEELTILAASGEQKVGVTTVTGMPPPCLDTCETRVSFKDTEVTTTTASASCRA